jgi:hypothetical protein
MRLIFFAILQHYQNAARLLAAPLPSLIFLSPVLIRTPPINFEGFGRYQSPIDLVPSLLA